MKYENEPNVAVIFKTFEAARIDFIDQSQPCSGIFDEATLSRCPKFLPVNRLQVANGPDDKCSFKLVSPGAGQLLLWLHHAPFILCRYLLFSKSNVNSISELRLRIYQKNVNETI